MKDLDYLHQLSLEMWQNLSMTLFFFEKVSLRGRLDIGSQPSGYDETHLPILGNSPWRPLVTLIGFIVVTQINRTYLVANGVNMMMLMCHQASATFMLTAVVVINSLLKRRSFHI